ncbi:MAG: hypothetical protein BGO74_10270 [Burkholderiales bacterium 68-12]|nr:MAG: hypothetical protein BGO74_10270 [Burkholderiales bacterium 68-12]
MKTIQALLTGAALSLLSLAAPAHEGEDHGSEPHSAPAMPQAGPRTEARTPDVEFVAALEAGRLVLHINRFATNEPLADAQVEVSSGTFNAVAVPATPGMYTLAGEQFKAAGRYPLTVSIDAADTSDLLTATLEVPAVEPPQATAPVSLRWWPWPLTGLLLASGMGLTMLRRRSSTDLLGRTV